MVFEEAEQAGSPISPSLSTVGLFILEQEIVPGAVVLGLGLRLPDWASRTVPLAFDGQQECLSGSSTC